jgi:hypothetical protein
MIGMSLQLFAGVFSMTISIPPIFNTGIVKHDVERREVERAAMSTKTILRFQN